MVHTTGGSFISAINTILNAANQVSYHFVISRDGEIVQAVDIANMAWANGTTNSGDNRDNRHSTVPTIVERRINANLYTISIGLGDMPAGNPSPQQLDALVALIGRIRAEVERVFNYTIPMTRDRIIGHNQVTPRTRPDCPGRSFPFDEVVRRLNAAPVPIAPPAPETSREQEIPSWAVAALEWAMDNGISDGSRPHDPATRAETITLLFRVFGLVANGPGEHNIAEAAPAIENPGPMPEPIPRAPLTLTEFELEALCKIVWAEARGEDDLGQRLVVHVVRNRMESPNFPNNLLEVLFQRNAFSPVHNGAFSRATPDERIRQRVLRALEEADYSHGATFFRTVAGAAGSWHEQNLRQIFDHGNHRFYKEA